MRWIYMMLLLAANPVFAESSVWVASKGAHKLFIGGTIHVLSKSDYPLPAEFDLAYSKSDQLVFETNISEAGSPEFQIKMMQRMSYANGQTLRGELSPEAYAALESYCKSRGIPLETMAQLKPQMVMLALVGIELQRMGMFGAGVDEHFYQRANKDNKPTQFLESVDKQLDLLVNMGKGQEDQLILNTVRDLNSIETMMNDMKSAWRTGDQKKLERVALTPMQNEFPELYQSLLVERNVAWLKYIERMLTTADVEFVLVGALHLIGQDGVIQQLRAKGYEITRL